MHFSIYSNLRKQAMIKYSWLNVKYSIELTQIWANLTLHKTINWKKWRILINYTKWQLILLGLIVQSGAWIFN
jgi:hypothetical protein